MSDKKIKIEYFHRIEKKEIPENSIKAILGRVKPKIEPGIKIKFHVKVFSSIGNKVAEFNIEADSKSEAELLAQRQIRKLGLSKVRLKIS